MKYCEKCRVKVDMDLIRCPLCSAVLTEDGGVSGEAQGTKKAVDGTETYAAAGTISGVNEGEAGGMPGTRNSKYPTAVVETASRYNFVLRLFLFLSVVIASTCILINILTYKGVLWSAYVAGSILYVWITVGYPVFTRRKLGQIIVINTLATAIYVYSLELATKTKGWGLTYVTPFLFIASTLFITFVILLKRLKWREYTVYQTILVIMGFLPVLFCAFGLVTAIWPSVISAFYSFLTVTGMFIFGDKKYKDELIKRFHL
jgi:hypothetical protein